MKQIHTEAWVRFYDLPQEYWRPKTLFEILAVVGTLITLADSMRRKAFKHILCKAFGGCRFSWNPLGRSDGGAWVLYAFFVSIEYKKLPFFCTQCNTINHKEPQYKKKVQSLGERVKQQPPTNLKPLTLNQAIAQPEEPKPLEPTTHNGVLGEQNPKENLIENTVSPNLQMNEHIA